MHLRDYTFRILFVLFLLFSFSPLAVVNAQTPVVQALLFYSPTCPICHEIMSDMLPQLMDKYGDRLQILNVNVSTNKGQALYQQAIQQYAIPDNRTGVPTIVIGKIVLVGGDEIPNFFENYVISHLEADGVRFPALPGLEAGILTGEFLLFGSEGSFGYEVTVWDRFSQDIVGNSLSVVVLLGMLFSLFQLRSIYSNAGRKHSPPSIPAWMFPSIALIGLGVASYLAYIDLTQVEPICGPVGNCGEVQLSKYAKLFGVFPVGVLGVFAYLVILIAWVLRNYGSEELKNLAFNTLWGFTIAGTLFSIYLTFLEPFVIGATCIWCITSAIAMTALLWLATFQALEMRSNRRRGKFRK